jgi:hypothetical protein
MPTSFHILSNFLVAGNRIIRLYIITIFKASQMNYKQIQGPRSTASPRMIALLLRKPALAAASRDMCGAQGSGQRYTP